MIPAQVIPRRDASSMSNVRQWTLRFLRFKCASPPAATHQPRRRRCFAVLRCRGRLCARARSPEPGQGSQGLLSVHQAVPAAFSNSCLLADHLLVLLFVIMPISLCCTAKGIRGQDTSVLVPMLVGTCVNQTLVLETTLAFEACN